MKDASSNSAAQTAVTFQDLDEQLDERLFFPCVSGYVFASKRFAQRLQMPFYGMIGLALDDDPVRIRTGGTTLEARAFALWAKDVYFDAAATRFVTVAANPLHPLFRAFAKISSPHAFALDASLFVPYRDLLLDAAQSRHFAHDNALRLFNGVHETARKFLPTVPRLDERAQRLMQLLCKDPRITLAQMAEQLGLSYHRTSHLFAEAVGIPLRTYQFWLKLFRAGAPLTRGASLTEAAHTAGFVDSAHYSKAFQSAYGRSPKDTFKRRQVIVQYHNPFSDESIGESIAAAATRKARTRSQNRKHTQNTATPAATPS